MPDGAEVVIKSEGSYRDKYPDHRCPPAVSHVLFGRQEPSGRRLA